MVGLTQSLKEFSGQLGQVSNAKHSVLLLKDQSLIKLLDHLVFYVYDPNITSIGNDFKD